MQDLTPDLNLVDAHLGIMLFAVQPTGVLSAQRRKFLARSVAAGFGD